MSDQTFLNQKIRIGQTEIPLLYLIGGVALLFIIFALFSGSGSVTDANGNRYATKRMKDGRVWVTENLRAEVEDSYCFLNTTENCETYGRLYTWQSAQLACESLGKRWRLPTDEEWGKLAAAYGGYKGESEDEGKGAAAALLGEGASGFKATLSGFGVLGQRFMYQNDMGAYWTSTELDGRYAWNYGFEVGTNNLVRDKITKVYNLCVRCIRD